MSYSPYGFADLGSLPNDLEGLVQEELSPGEKLAWVGRPRPSRLIAEAMPSFVFGLFFTGFAFFWIFAAGGGMGPPRIGRRGGGAPSVFLVFGIPFVLAGVGMLAAPFVAARNARKTCYALTDRRAIVWESSPWYGTRVRSYQAGELRSMARHQRGDGSGDLIFEETFAPGNRGRQKIVRRGFIAIEDVRGVEALIRSNLLDA